MSLASGRPSRATAAGSIVRPAWVQVSASASPRSAWYVGTGPRRVASWTTVAARPVTFHSVMASFSSQFGRSTQPVITHAAPRLAANAATAAGSAATGAAVT